MSNDPLSRMEERINDIEHRLSVVETELKWIKWLLGIELPALFALVIGVAKLIIG